VQRQPQVPLDWVRGLLVGMRADASWQKESEIADWLEARLFFLRVGWRQITLPRMT
jgi:hypothetical protein